MPQHPGDQVVGLAADSLAVEELLHHLLRSLAQVCDLAWEARGAAASSLAGVQK